MFSYKDDLPKILDYNSHRRPDSKTRLHVEMGPSPYDGDPFAAKVLLLMNNPGYDPNVSKPADHELAFNGWPIAGLHPDAPELFRDWYKRPLGYLLSRYPAQHISRRVCILQLCPWASQEFDSNLVLPSREHQIALARSAAERGAIVIVGRSFSIWPQEFPRVHAGHRRNPTLSPKSLDQDTWRRVELAISDQ